MQGGFGGEALRAGFELAQLVPELNAGVAFDRPIAPAEFALTKYTERLLNRVGDEAERASGVCLVDQFCGSRV